MPCHDGQDATTLSRRGDWIQTYTGVRFWPVDPRPEDVRIEDVAHALSLQCRFGGHVREFYSVAQHSVLVSRIVSPRSALWGLLHDASEAYLMDFPRPLKHSCMMGDLYRQLERRLMRVIAVRFGLPPEEPAEVKRADTILLVTEKRDLLVMPPRPLEDTAEPLEARIVPMSPPLAEATFLTRFYELWPAAAGADRAAAIVPASPQEV